MRIRGRARISRAAGNRMPAAHSIPGAMSKNLSLCAVAVVVGGCALEELEELEEHGTISSFILPVSDCDDPLVCPGNSDLMGVLGPYELDATGTTDSQRGFRIIGMTHGGQTVTALDVGGASVRVTRAAGIFTGPGVLGLTLRLRHSKGREFDLVIDDYLTSKVPYYAGGSPDIDGYHVSYTEVGTHDTRNLCPYATAVDDGFVGTWAVFWKGDRFDPDTGQIFASGAGVGSWFNLSCAGEAPIKMLRARTGGAVAPLSPVDQRQATLNMFTASYCGPGGKRYTELGQAIAWSDLSGPSQMGAASVEAIWDEDGAVCLDEPRLFDLDEIACGNPIPKCTAAEVGQWQLSGWLLSGNP